MIVQECLRSDVSFLFKQAYKEGLNFSKTKSKNVYFKAVLNNDIVGFAKLMLLSDNHVRLGNLYVLPEHRNKGIGTMLIEYRITLYADKTIDTYTYYPELYPNFVIKNSRDTKQGCIYHMVKHA